jgi:hypothetical protein
MEWVVRLLNRIALKILNQVSYLNLERIGDNLHRLDRDIALPALDFANVCSV